MTARSDIFDLQRWCRLIAKHWTENRKKYGLFLLAYTGLLTAWYSFILMMNTGVLLDITMQFATYFVGLYLAGCLYASTLFAELSSRREGLNYLALPASQLEKLLCVLFYGVLIFFVGYTVIYYLIDIPLVNLANLMLERHPRNMPGASFPIPQSPVYNIFTADMAPLPERDTHLFLLGFFSIQAVFIAGPLYFSRYALIKSIVTVLFCMLVFVIMEQKIVGLFLPDGWHNRTLSWIRYDEDDHPSQYLALPETLTWGIIRLMQFGMPLMIWIITYHRLKEKQI